MGDEHGDAAMHRWRQKTQPMPTQRAALPFERVFSSQDWQKVVRGVVPRQMEDKWLIYTEGDTIYFHRSWTGFCVYQVNVERQGEGYVVRGATVNRDETQYNERGAGYEAALLGFLIDALLLGKPASFPIPEGLPKDTPAGLFQHHISGTAFPEARKSGGSDGGQTA